MLLLLVEAKGLREEVYQSECDCFCVVSLASYLASRQIHGWSKNRSSSCFVYVHHAVRDLEVVITY